MLSSSEIGSQIKNAFPIKIIGGGTASSIENGKKHPGGDLTIAGFRQGFDLGEYLRENYEIKDLNEIFARSTGTNRTVETARSILAGILEDFPAEITIEISSPEQEFMAMKIEKLLKYPKIHAVEQYLGVASIMNQIQHQLGEEAMNLANISWEVAQGMNLFKIS